MILHFHPFASFCQKVLIGLYELEIPFERNIVHLEKPEERDALAKLWPFAKFPVIEDDTFSMADCAAAPSLFYANLVLPFGRFPNVAAYFARLEKRPSYARVRAEAEPYMRLFPG